MKGFAGRLWIPAPRFHEDKLRGNDDRIIVFKRVTPGIIERRRDDRWCTCEGGTI